jgi:hypothetical protein
VENIQKAVLFYRGPFSRPHYPDWQSGFFYARSKMSELNIVPVPGYGQLADLGKKYGVTRFCIFDIKRGKSWKHL